MNEYVYCPDLWIKSLPDYLFKYIGELAGEDKYNLEQLGKCKFAVENGKYRNNSRKQRMKLKAVQRQLSDGYLYNFLKKRNIVINLIVINIAEYWKKKNSYEGIMEELDKLIIVKKSTCNCRNIEFGLCFCRDKEGNYINPPW